VRREDAQWEGTGKSNLVWLAWRGACREVTRAGEQANPSFMHPLTLARLPFASFPPAITNDIDAPAS
jgi:hypothetical protein